MKSHCLTKTHFKKNTNFNVITKTFAHWEIKFVLEY